MIPARYLRPLLVALLTLLALAPYAGRPLPASAATLAFTVTSTADTHDANPGDGLCADVSNHCTVRAAIEDANAQPRGSSIAVTIPPGNYALALGTLTPLHNAIALAGAGAGRTILDGRGQRVLAVAVTAFVTISGLMLRGGNAGASGGGALANSGVTIVSRSAVVSDTAKNGGGIANGLTGRLWLLQSTVVSDTAPGGAGGGIANQGQLTVSGSVLSGNTALIGGAIASTGTLTLLASSVTTNTATVPGFDTRGGGGIYTSGTATVINSTLNGNTASSDSGGGIENDGGALTVTNSTLSGNMIPNRHGGFGGGIGTSGTATVISSTLSDNSAPYGGGIANQCCGVLTVANSTLNSNTVAYEGGGIETMGTLTVANSTLNGNTVISGFGGGINNQAGTLTVISSTLSGNTAGSPSYIQVGLGGGINNNESATVISSTIGGNTASGGGGGINNNGGSMMVTGSTINGNSTGLSGSDGSAIANEPTGVMTVTDTTISGNSGTINGANTICNCAGVTAHGFYNGLKVGGSSISSGNVNGFQFPPPTVLTLTYVTVASNSDGIANYTSISPATITLTGTIVANSASGPNCKGTISESQGYNLDNDGSCGLSKPTDLSNTNPLLGSLANNGGPTLTMALLAGSLAIDHGGTSANGCPPIDQRGVARPQGSACDIGAFEAAGRPPFHQG